MSDFQTAGNLPLVLLLAATASLFVWTAACVRWSAGGEAVPWRPREPCPWQPMAVGLALPVSIAVQVVVLSTVAEADSFSIARLHAQCLAVVLEIFVLMGLLATGTPIRPEDFGMRPLNLSEDFQYGLLGFLAALLPVYAINLAVELLHWRQEGAKHALFRILEENPGPETIAWVALAAVVLAPLAEELLYRVILQGWLETRLSPHAAVLFVGIVFAWVHYEPGRPDHLPLLPLAFILGYVYYRRHSYPAVVILHATFNATNLALAIASRGSGGTP